MTCNGDTDSMTIIYDEMICIYYIFILKVLSEGPTYWPHA